MLALAVVAARDEEGRVGETVRAIRELPVDEIVVVDDGSRDGTTADAYLLLDADLGATASAAVPLLNLVRDGKADLAIAVLPRQPGHGGFRIVKRISGRLIRSLSGFRAREPMSGQRAMTREVLEAVRPLAPGFGVETAMTIDAARAGFRVVEVEVPMSHRVTRRDLAGFAHRARQGRDVLAAAWPRAIGRR